jgi:hypothetical protein
MDQKSQKEKMTNKIIQTKKMQRKLLDKFRFMLAINGISLDTYFKEMVHPYNPVCKKICLKEDHNSGNCPFMQRGIYYNKITQKFQVITNSYTELDANGCKTGKGEGIFYCAGFVTPDINEQQ